MSASKPLATRLGWRVESTGYAYRGSHLDVRRDEVLPPGAPSPIEYAYVEHPGSVFVVPLLGDGRVALMRSYRYPTDSMCWEVPAGRLDGGRTPEQVARAELGEEIGATCETLEPIGDWFLANGFARCRGWFFLARGVELAEPQRLEPGEQIDRIDALPIDEALARLLSSGQDGESALALLLAARTLRKETPA